MPLSLSDPGSVATYLSLFSVFKRNCRKTLLVSLLSLTLVGIEAKGLGKCIIKSFMMAWGMVGRGGQVPLLGSIGGGETFILCSHMGPNLFL